jgi:hypothetical protein
MSAAYLRVVKDAQATKDRARAAIEAHTAISHERTSPALIPVRKGRHLDVDAVLARSLPEVVSE